MNLKFFIKSNIKAPINPNIFFIIVLFDVLQDSKHDLAKLDVLTFLIEFLHFNFVASIFDNSIKSLILVAISVLLFSLTIKPLIFSFINSLEPHFSDIKTGIPLLRASLVTSPHCSDELNNISPLEFA